MQKTMLNRILRGEVSIPPTTKVMGILETILWNVQPVQKKPGSIIEDLRRDIQAFGNGFIPWQAWV